MPNLKPWIEAQLKRGYTKSQIKKVLVKKGYPLNAVAEVDRVRHSELPDKKNSKKVSYKHVILAVIVIALLVWIFNASPFSSKQTAEDVIVPEMESDEQVDEEATELENRGEFSVSEILSTNLCRDFPEIAGEISCKEAIELALAEYPGEVKYVDKAQILTQDTDEISIPDTDEIPPQDTDEIPSQDISPPPDAASTIKNEWLIGISLEKAIETPEGESKNIEVTVDSLDKTIRLYKIG